MIPLTKDLRDSLNEAIEYCTPRLDVFTEAQLPKSESDSRTAILPTLASLQQDVLDRWGYEKDVTTVRERP